MMAVPRPWLAAVSLALRAESGKSPRRSRNPARAAARRSPYSRVWEVFGRVIPTDPRKAAGGASLSW